jgi:hypothetical protein
VSLPAASTPRPGEPAADPLRCASCDRVQGSAVAFCPFCGAAQHGAAAPQSATPHPVPSQSAVSPPLLDVDTVWNRSIHGGPLVPTPDGRPPPVPAQPAPQTGPAQTGPTQVVPARIETMQAAPARGGPRSPWTLRRSAGVVAALLLGAIGLRQVLAPAPRATLVVRVHGPGGAAITAGHVLVDNRQAGVPGQSLVVAPGSHRVAFDEPGWRPDSRSVSVARDATLAVDLAVQELPAHLALATEPAGATLRIGGRSYGQSPLGVDLRPGSYELAVTLGGYATRIVPVTLARGEQRSVSVDLAPMPAPVPVPVPVPAAPPPALPPAAPPVRLVAPPFGRGVVSAPTPLQAAPSGGADTLALLAAASEVQVQAEAVTDEPWLQLRADGRQGFVRGDAVESWDAWAQRNVADGAIEAVTPDLRVVVAGRACPLAGVRVPERGSSAAGLARAAGGVSAALRGTAARCTPRDTASFQCKTSEGRDIAEMLLLNGAAVTAEGALPYYADAQRSARDRQKGVWSE